MKFRGLATVTAGWQRVLFTPALACFCVSAYAATSVGTQVDNQAVASHDIGKPGGDRTEEASEVESFVVQELTDLGLVYLGNTPQLVSSPSDKTVLTYELSHLGNGQEQYFLSFENLTEDDFDAVDPVIYIDDGDQAFDADLDAVYDVNQPPNFDQEEIKQLFVVVSIPAGLAINDLANSRLTAVAVGADDKAGQPGALISGGGDNGEDLVIGRNGAKQSVDLPLLVSNNASLVLDKTITDVSDPNGGDRPLPGAVISYQIEVSYTGEGQIDALVITDVIPENTDYQLGSLKLDGQVQSDLADGDAAEFDEENNQVVFRLGDVVVPSAAQVIEFKVTIK